MSNKKEGSLDSLDKLNIEVSKKYIKNNNKKGLQN